MLEAVDLLALFMAPVVLWQVQCGVVVLYLLLLLPPVPQDPVALKTVQTSMEKEGTL